MHTPSTIGRNVLQRFQLRGPLSEMVSHSTIHGVVPPTTLVTSTHCWFNVCDSFLTHDIQQYCSMKVFFVSLMFTWKKETSAAACNGKAAPGYCRDSKASERAPPLDGASGALAKTNVRASLFNLEQTSNCNLAAPLRHTGSTLTLSGTFWAQCCC